MELLEIIFNTITSILPIGVFLILAILLYNLFLKNKGKSVNSNIDKTEINDESKNDVSITDIDKYKRKYLLTKNELYFYKTLKVIADKYDFVILAKIRLADLVEVKSDISKQEKWSFFQKIKSKHIDFALCNKNNLYPEILIELTDSSHNENSRKARDDFVEKVLTNTGYKIIFVRSANEVANVIEELKVETNVIS